MFLVLLTSFAFLDPIPTNDAALKKEQETAWADLAEWDEIVATRALLKLANRPVESTAFLKKVLKPLNIQGETVKKMIEDLASEDEKVWKPAFETFEYQDPRLVFTLGQCFHLSKEGLGRQRLVAVLCDVEPKTYEKLNIQLLPSTINRRFLFSANDKTWCAEDMIGNLAGSWNDPESTNCKRYWERAQRAIVLLEHIKSKEAIELLEAMATGHPEAAPTSLAKHTLKKLKAK